MKNPNMTEVMLDIETLGTGHNAPVLSIGAVFMDLNSGLLGSEFYATLDLDSQLKAGRLCTASTIKFWMEQDNAAKRVFREEQYATSTAMVLAEFCTWFTATNPDAKVWGYGSNFDVTIMEHLLDQHGFKFPWTFRNIMDLRTFKRFVAGDAQIVSTGTYHNALDDAKSQALYVIEHNKKR